TTPPGAPTCSRGSWRPVTRWRSSARALARTCGGRRRRARSPSAPCPGRATPCLPLGCRRCSARSGATSSTRRSPDPRASAWGSSSGSWRGGGCCSTSTTGRSAASPRPGGGALVPAVRRLGRAAVMLALVGAGRRWAQGPQVIATDPIPFDDVPRYLAAADVVAVPQRATSDTVGQMPAKIFDALALGRPVVSTRVSMIPEVLDGCGLVVPPGAPPALRAATGRLLDDQALARELGARGRVRCEALYSFTAARARLFPLVERVAASGRP